MKYLQMPHKGSIFAPCLREISTGEVAEWSNAAVLKTVDCYRSGGSNPSLSASKVSNFEQNPENQRIFRIFCFLRCAKKCMSAHIS